MSNASDEPRGPDVPDEALPDDLRPSEDNPLAQPLDDDAETDGLDVLGGKTPEQWDEHERGREADAAQQD